MIRNDFSYLDGTSEILALVWRTIKYQHIYLNPAEDGITLYRGIKKWMDRYHNRNHQGINKKPIEKYKNAA